MDTPIGLDGTIGSDFSLDNHDDLTQFSQLESLGDSEQGSTTVQLPDPALLLVPSEDKEEEPASNQVKKEEGQTNDLGHQEQSGGYSKPESPHTELLEKMDIDMPDASQSATELEPPFKAAPEAATNDVAIASTATNTDNQDDPLAKIKQIQLLPELYNILFDFTNGKIHPRDFDKHIGNLRSKLDNLKLYILEIDGIDVTPEIMMNEINRLKENNVKKQTLLNSFRNKIKNDFV
mgnify:CR=1 FL=1